MEIAPGCEEHGQMAPGERGWSGQSLVSSWRWICTPRGGGSPPGDGLLVGSLAAGRLLAVTMANACGARDNAKK